MQYTIDGFVIRSCDYGENDRLLTILTAERGRIVVIAKGAKSMKSKYMSISEPYVYANFEISQKGNYLYLRGGSIIENFFSIREEINSLFLSNYLADLVYEMSEEDFEAEDLLRLALNSFYAMANKKYEYSIIKSVFELRLASMSGYEPDVSACRKCGKNEAEEFYFDIMSGNIVCKDCFFGTDMNKEELYDKFGEHREKSIIIKITPSVLSAIRYIIYSKPEKIFSFLLKENEDKLILSKVAEEYLLNHIERGFESLNMYNSIK